MNQLSDDKRLSFNVSITPISSTFVISYSHIIFRNRSVLPKTMKHTKVSTELSMCYQMSSVAEVSFLSQWYDIISTAPNNNYVLIALKNPLSI